MRTIKKHNNRISGIVVPSEICFLLVGLCFLGSWLFQQPIVPVQIIKKPIVFTENHTIINLFGWHGNRFPTGTFFWERFVTKADLKFAFKAYCNPHAHLVPYETHLTVLHYMRHSDGNILLLQEMSCRGITESFWFNKQTMEFFLNREMWPPYCRQYPQAFKLFIKIWKGIIV